MKDFDESGIVFSFDESKWEITQFDKERDYINVSNALKETKAVDFIGIHDNHTVYFFEIKSFRGHSLDQSVKNRLKNGAEDLAVEVAQKVKDTLACLLAGARNSTNQSGFWLKVCDIIKDKEKDPVRIFAWIEEDRKGKHQKERNVELSVRTSKLKSKLGWLSKRVFIIDLAKKEIIPDFDVRLGN